MLNNLTRLSAFLAAGDFDLLAFFLAILGGERALSAALCFLPFLAGDLLRPARFFGGILPGGLVAGVLGVGDGVTDDVLEEHLQDAAGLFVDEA